MIYKVSVYGLYTPIYIYWRIN